MCEHLHIDLGTPPKRGIWMLAENVSNYIPSRGSTIVNQPIDQSYQCCRSTIWNWFNIVCICIVYFGSIFAAKLRIHRKHTNSEESGRLAYLDWRRKSYRYRLDLHHLRLHLLGLGHVDRGIRLLLWVSLAFHRLHRWGNYLGSELFVSSGSQFLSHGRVKKGAWVSREITCDLNCNKCEISQSAVVWATLSTSIRLISVELSWINKSLCLAVFIARENTNFELAVNDLPLL